MPCVKAALTEKLVRINDERALPIRQALTM